MTEKDPYRFVFIALSITIPAIVVLLFNVEIKGYDFRFLPPIYAFINGTTAVLLIAAWFCIINHKQRAHEVLMKICLFLSFVFLVMYMLYHMTTKTTEFGGQGMIRYVYFTVLISHIILSVTVVPLVLFTFSRALSGNFVWHKILARITFPIWLYVAISGVVVYYLISPYYA